MTELYDKGFLRDTIQIIRDELHDLELWSFYNKDIYTDEIITIRTAVEALRTKEEHDRVPQTSK